MDRSNKNIEEIVANNIILDSEIGEHSIEICPVEEEVLDGSFEDVSCCFDISEDVIFNKCQDNEEKTIGPIRLRYQSRLLRINILLKNVCRGRKIALGILVCEGKTIKGFKGTEIVVPGKPGSGCTDIRITNFCFVLPEKNICDRRKVDVKAIAHYTDLNPLSNCLC
ncbi:hypothetical protein [Wukongibacter sp. M2B1]|uniref:hypothetical protein n=1 Tax=Wukongibacter sp. M2B1 TaxID=3088895 RepID=UPI003D7A0376